MRFVASSVVASSKIRKFCETRDAVTFPLFAEIATQPGADPSPVYALLTKGRPAPSRNFCKYLVGKDGKAIAFYESEVTPADPGLREAIEAALKQGGRAGSPARRSVAVRSGRSDADPLAAGSPGSV